ncbi:hypothetical protein Smp_199970, partial [Schistosoma mansoni]|uniref:hypothetical protein n=1 Tax=Schistosoma mansoni TaxID=6183 RepID=UPI00022C850C
ESEKQAALPQAATAEERYLKFRLSDFKDKGPSPNFLGDTCAAVRIVPQTKADMER